jgi:hypothetical protein
MCDGFRAFSAIFKPSDEEPYTPNNPRGNVANWGIIGREMFQMRPGVKPGEGFHREVAAYLLDHDGFAGVPATMVVEARHKALRHAVRIRSSSAAEGFDKLVGRGGMRSLSNVI